MTRRWDIRVGAVLIIIATVGLSFASLYELAHLCGFGVLAWFWPVCLDAVAYVATRLWLDKGQAWRGARALALAAIGLSVGANGLVHALAPGTVLPGIPVLIVIAVGSVPPVMLALVIHVLVSAGTGTVARSDLAPGVLLIPAEPVQDVPVHTVQNCPELSRTVPVQPAVPVTEPERVPVRTALDQPKPKTVRANAANRAADDELLDKLCALAVELGHRPSVGKTRTALGVGTGRAEKLLARFDQLPDPVRDDVDPVASVELGVPVQTGLHLVPVSTGTTDQ